MGTFGFGLFQDDCAMDVRDHSLALLRQGVEDDAATAQMLGHWKETLDDSDEGPVFWLALALTQHNVGRLNARVQARAREVLATGAGLERWREAGPAQLRKRTAALTGIDEALEAPQPPRKAFKAPFRDTCPWPVGTQVAYERTDGAWVVLHVVGTEVHDHGTGTVVQWLAGTAATPPDAPVAWPPAAHRLGPLSLARWLAAAGASDVPALAFQQVLASIGALDPAIAKRWVLDGGPQNDWAKHYRAIEKALDRLKAGEPALVQRLAKLAEEQAPGISGPIHAFALRRVERAGELPRKRTRVLGLRLTASVEPLLAVRWAELDDFLADVQNSGS